MDIVDFKIFKDFYILRNITEVSKKNFLSQPTVSYRLNKMQEELQSKLYDYRWGKYRFTIKGHLFYRFCSQTLKDFKKIQNGNSDRERVNVSLSIIAKHLYLDKLYDLVMNNDMYPVIRFNTAENTIQEIVNDRTLFGIIGLLDQELPRFIEKVYLKKQTIKLIYNNLLPDDIKMIPLVLDEEDSELSRSVEKYLEQFEGITISGEVCTSFDKIKLVNKNQIGIFIPEEFIGGILQKNNNIKTSENYSFERELYLVFNKKNKDDILVHQVIDILNEGQSSIE